MGQRCHQMSTTKLIIAWFTSTRDCQSLSMLQWWVSSAVDVAFSGDSSLSVISRWISAFYPFFLGRSTINWSQNNSFADFHPLLYGFSKQSVLCGFFRFTLYELNWSDLPKSLLPCSPLCRLEVTPLVYNSVWTGWPFRHISYGDSLIKLVLINLSYQLCEQWADFIYNLTIKLSNTGNIWPKSGRPDFMEARRRWFLF